MMKRKNNYKNGSKRDRLTPDHPENRENAYYFGYKSIPEDEKAFRVRMHFDTVAPKYDFMNTLLSFGIHLLWKRTAVRILGLKGGDRIIDVCGGTGDLSILASRRAGPSGLVVLYDINRDMLERGRTKIIRSSYGRRIFSVQGDAESISFPDHYFDAAMVGFGIRNLTHMNKGFREMHRVLKPGGTLMCLEFSKPTAPVFSWLYDFYSFHIMPLLGWAVVGSRQAYTYLPESIRMFPLPHELTRILERAGFSQVTHRKLTNGIAVAHLAKKE